MTIRILVALLVCCSMASAEVIVMVNSAGTFVYDGTRRIRVADTADQIWDDRTDQPEPPPPPPPGDDDDDDGTIAERVAAIVSEVNDPGNAKTLGETYKQFATVLPDNPSDQRWDNVVRGIKMFQAMFLTGVDARRWREPLATINGIMERGPKTKATLNQIAAGFAATLPAQVEESERVLSWAKVLMCFIQAVINRGDERINWGDFLNCIFGEFGDITSEAFSPTEYSRAESIYFRHHPNFGAQE